MTRQLFDTGDWQLRRVLRDLREGPPAPPSAREHLRGALRLASVSAPFASRPAHSASRTLGRLPASATPRWFVWALGGGGAVALVGAWLALGPRGGAESALPTRAPPLVVEETRVEMGEPIAAPGSTLPEAKVPTPLPIVAPAPDKPERQTTRDTSLGAERRLLDAARAALVAGDIRAGLARLADHGRQFPHGALAEEREALSIDALVAAGRHDEARRRADAFRVRHPGSLFAPSVAAALRAIP